MRSLEVLRLHSAANDQLTTGQEDLLGYESNSSSFKDKWLLHLIKCGTTWL